MENTFNANGKQKKAGVEEKLEKEEQKNPKMSRRKEILKI